MKTLVRTARPSGSESDFHAAGHDLVLTRPLKVSLKVSSVAKKAMEDAVGRLAYQCKPMIGGTDVVSERNLGLPAHFFKKAFLVVTIRELCRKCST